eukprot:CAMPEP_0183353556 /NCGR_PEP_ID=MMETSP0164_2-20130417/33647_1 /TAXON_ID=221442 /ORGANISM="Coccolithus pelagicus ssp braarudi, Strain PLY182g" /LENGTH=60 /DNA_ID=CAMNT_0025526243 /DNA_START=618 /DNA_END=797 /DNA_ORIENTATION=-
MAFAGTSARAARAGAAHGSRLGAVSAEQREGIVHSSFAVALSIATEMAFRSRTAGRGGDG